MEVTDNQSGPSLSQASTEQIRSELLFRSNFQPVLIFPDVIAPSGIPSIVYNWNQIAARLHLPMLNETDLYQEACANTESPVINCQVDPKAGSRWETSFPVLLHTLSDVEQCMASLKVDAQKKYAAYGKVPNDLQIVGQIPIRSTSADFNELSCEDPEVFRLVHMVFGLASECEELITALIRKSLHCLCTKRCITLADFDKVNILEEIGDMEWYLAGIANIFHAKLSVILATNTAKLEKRYKGAPCIMESTAGAKPEAKAAFEALQWKADNANNRDLSAERQILEDGLAPKEVVKEVPFNSNEFCTFCDKYGHLHAVCPVKASFPPEVAPLLIDPVTPGPRGIQTGAPAPKPRYEGPKDSGAGKFGF